MEKKKYYGIQQSIDLQFFCEELYNNTYRNERKVFIKELMTLIQNYADAVANIVAEESRKETLLSLEKDVKKAFKSIEEENVFKKLSDIMNEEEEEDIDSIFGIDK